MSLLSAIASILWILLYTLINDLAQSPFVGMGTWTFKLFVPSLIFSLSCLCYVRVRRSMDKEKIRRMEHTEILLRQISATLTEIVYDALNHTPSTQRPFTIDPCHADDLNMYYMDYFENNGDQSKIPRNTRSFIAALPKPKRSALLPS